MWLLVAREPQPDAPYWTGRRLLSAIDAVSWPILWMILVSQVDTPVGVVGPAIIFVAILCLVERIHRAVWANHRYWFTTWRWGRIAMALLVFGMVLKLTVPA